MTLLERLNDDLKSFMKAREAQKLETIRTLLSAVKYARIEKGEELADSDVLRVIQKAVKQREDSITQFRDGGRLDLVEKEQAEADLLKTYLPQALSTDELRTAVKAVIAETGASSVKDMGKVMKGVMAKTAGRADGAEINKLVREILN